MGSPPPADADEAPADEASPRTLRQRLWRLVPWVIAIAALSWVLYTYPPARILEVTLKTLAPLSVHTPPDRP